MLAFSVLWLYKAMSWQETDVSMYAAAKPRQNPDWTRGTNQDVGEPNHNRSHRNQRPGDQFRGEKVCHQEPLEPWKEGPLLAPIVLRRQSQKRCLGRWDCWNSGCALCFCLPVGSKYPDSTELREQGSLGNGVHECPPAKIPRTEWTWELWCWDGDQPAALFG